MPPGPADLPDDATVYTVDEFSRLVRGTLDEADHLQDVWVQGEVTGVHEAKSGHLYFKLKDDRNVLEVAIFRWEGRDVPADLAEGDEVLVHGDVGTYASRSTYQLVGVEVRPAGRGALYQRYLELKADLEEAGLFASERKRPLPALPRVVGVVTSPRGAAVRDIVTVARRRFPNVDLLVTPCLVQGPGAAHAIVTAIERQVRAGRADLLIVGRGGGSIEDLWAFNEEPVVRAVADCPIPVVSAVGHETDTTLTDLAADVRAPTPSAAAEIAVPDRAELAEQVDAGERALAQDLRRLVRRSRDVLASTLRRTGLVHPERMVQERAQRVDDLRRRLATALGDLWSADREAFARAEAQLSAGRPDRLVRERRRELRAARRDLVHAARHRLAEGRRSFVEGATALRGLSPLAVLERGYAVVQRPDGQPVTRVVQTAVGERLDLRFADGRASTRVEATEARPTEEATP